MIELRQLSKSYGSEKAVDGVSLDVPRGTITAIVGTSGSGKSTLLRLVNRLIVPDHGQVVIDGQDAARLPQADLRRRIGYVIQDNGLFPHWTAARNIGTVPRLLGWDAPRIASRVAELLELLQLQPQIASRYPHELSGGQAQRVGVARALAADPDVLLMDEPFGALDPVVRKRARQDLRALQQRIGTTILLVTHDMDEAIGLGDQIAVMRNGRIEQCDTPARILADPATPFVRDLVGEGQRAFRYLSIQTVASLRESGQIAGTALPPETPLSTALEQMLWTGCDMLPIAGGGVIRRDAILKAAQG
ncbi:ABC transporter ATP-binding protein [Paracoccus shanxieyensis]|uniref:ATP-binding cassette domain-containing protein n=1 Tax=Paracoccus shanxieyensis TaxID=2675752 RepID=A0A6L6J268_9RHOB|nr:ABC transporter ATP-binding protein [Paracoccus shanxieyensis]MTH64864.1 ATP-binding cassette domain-containing protein [Paracoccus shanxieyensis]MTH87903.1 ATP-binding cassette domain-containing protein [Paracoccus shanxieyensis]